MKMSAVPGPTLFVSFIIGHPEFIWGPPGAAPRALLAMRPMRRRESRLPLRIVHRLPDFVPSAVAESGVAARAFPARSGRASGVPPRLGGSAFNRMGIAPRGAVGGRRGPADPPPWVGRSYPTLAQRGGCGPVASVPEGLTAVDSDEPGGKGRLGGSVSLPVPVRVDAVPSGCGISASGGHARPCTGGGGRYGRGSRGTDCDRDCTVPSPSRNVAGRAGYGSVPRTSLDGPRARGGRDSGSRARSRSGPTGAGPRARTSSAVAGTTGAATAAGTRTRAGGGTRGRGEIDRARGDEERHRG